MVVLTTRTGSASFAPTSVRLRLHDGDFRAPTLVSKSKSLKWKRPSYEKYASHPVEQQAWQQASPLEFNLANVTHCKRLWDLVEVDSLDEVHEDTSHLCAYSSIRVVADGLGVK